MCIYLEGYGVIKLIYGDIHKRERERERCNFKPVQSITVYVTSKFCNKFIALRCVAIKVLAFHNIISDKVTQPVHLVHIYYITSNDNSIS